MAAQVDPQPAEFGNLQADAGAEAKSDINMDVILDVPVTLSMEVGRTRVPIRKSSAAQPGLRRGARTRGGRAA